MFSYFFRDGSQVYPFPWIGTKLEAQRELVDYMQQSHLVCADAARICPRISQWLMTMLG